MDTGLIIIYNPGNNKKQVFHLNICFLFIATSPIYANGKMISTNTNGQLFNKWNQGPLGTHGLPGDSGSPLFAYDTLLQKWVVVGVHV
ncbi:hypothetical protein KAP06_004890 [Salmonella enterica subsp. enterica serovar 4,[5],12:i:-]|nr:hypothetical protein [Salmonella enterica subsp. enterica serovar 4,[5],12:i:-]EHJ8683696.1 hypothetical protein [Salmonella enterica subsp. enterica serovar 4,[5],12:i:-]